MRPRPTRTQRFAQMLETDLLQSTEELATTPCRTALAAGAKGMVLDMVRGKSAVIRMIFTFMDELDVMEGNLVRTRRARPVRIPEWAEADDGDETASLDEQGLGEETPLPMWGEFASEVPSSGMKTESPPAAADKGARPLTEGNEQGVETESERQFLAVSRRVPSEKELRRREEQAEMERGRQAYESARATVKAFAEKHGYEFPGTGSAEPVKDAPLPLTEGRSQGIQIRAPKRDPTSGRCVNGLKDSPRRSARKLHARRRRRRVCSCFDRLSMRIICLALSLVLRFNRGKGGPTRETPNHCRTSPSGCADSRRRREGAHMEARI